MLGVAGEDEAVRARIAQALRALVLAGRVIVEPVDGERAVYDAPIHSAEVRLAAPTRARLRAVRRASSPGWPPRSTPSSRAPNVELAPEQRDAVSEAARRQLLVVTGGPGVGKTTIVRAILAVLARARVDVRLAAPDRPRRKAHGRGDG